MSTKTEFEFDLKHTFQFESSGGQVEAHKLILKGPTPKNMVERGLLKHECSKIIEWIEKKAEDVAEKKGTSTSEDIPDSKTEKEELIEESIDELGEIIQLGIYAAPGVDIKLMLGQFRKLMVDCKRCSVEGEKDLTSSLFDKIQPSDQDRMMGLYLANFMLPS